MCVCERQREREEREREERERENMSACVCVCMHECVCVCVHVYVLLTVFFCEKCHGTHIYLERYDRAAAKHNIAVGGVGGNTHTQKKNPPKSCV